MTFTAWMAKVDAEVSRQIGLSVHDLPDQPFRDWFDCEMTPAEAAGEVLAELGDEMGDLDDIMDALFG